MHRHTDGQKADRQTEKNRDREMKGTKQNKDRLTSPTITYIFPPPSLRERIDERGEYCLQGPAPTSHTVTKEEGEAAEEDTQHTQRRPSPAVYNGTQFETICGQFSTIFLNFLGLMTPP